MNKKKIIGLIAIFAFIAVAVLNIRLGFNENSVAQLLKLNSMDSLSACEISSDPNENIGYCVPIYGGNGDACIESAGEYHVRCSGTA
ncbi:MAG: hypothetical protein LBL07_09390 [Tannerella sp.]|jgi:hypothetical protein|nr:hypothetical protein [Tannerella sp.]